MFAWWVAIVKYIETFIYLLKNIFLSSQYPTNNECSKLLSSYKYHTIHNNENKKKKNIKF